MDHGFAAGERGLERCGVGEIADERFAADAFEVGEVAGFADEEAEIGAFGGERPGHMMADETGGACEEDFHRLESTNAILNRRVAWRVCGQWTGESPDNAKLHYNRRVEVMRMPIVSTTTRGQLTFRKEIFQHVGIKPGEKLEFDLLPGGESVAGRCGKRAASAILPDA